jgi:predicted outer membrane repeat protein
MIANNKQPFGNDKYWSSTPATDENYPEMWYANFGSMSINSINALQYNRLRPMRAFLLNVGAGHGGGIYATTGARIEGCLVYGNTAAEGTGVYTIGNVPVHYTTVAVNTQSSSGYAQSQGLVTAFTPGVSEMSSVTNSIIWGNRDADNNPSNITITANTRVLYTAWESAGTVTGTGNIALPSDNFAENGIKFKNPNNFDFNIVEASACALTGDKRRIPAALTSDLNGVPRSSTLAKSMGAFEFIPDPDGLNDLFADSEIAVYPNPVRSGAILTIVNRSNYSELTVSVINLVGQFITSERFTGNDLQLQMPNDAGTYFVKVTTNEGVSITKKISVQL